MANITVTTNMTLEDVIDLGWDSASILTITNNATVSVTQTPSINSGSVVLSGGYITVEGLTITSPNIETSVNQTSIHEALDSYVNKHMWKANGLDIAYHVWSAELPVQERLYPSSVLLPKFTLYPLGAN